MYHKHTDPEKEKRMARIERILSMVINDLSCGEMCKPAGGNYQALLDTSPGNT